ncbi:MAG: hypothetical protein QM622_12155 [Microbacterium sp.]
MPRLLLHADNTHLYRGARLEASTDFPVDPGAVRIAFRDGIEVDAMLTPGEEDGELHIVVPAYRTAAGAEIAPKRWGISRVAATGGGRDAGVVGQRVSSAL